MKKIFLLLAAIALFFTACKKDNQRPEDLLPKEKMAVVMADMAEAEAKIKNLRLPVDSGRQIYRIYENTIFKNRGVTSERYKESYQYYLLNYKEMSAIHNAIIDTLSRRHLKALEK